MVLIPFQLHIIASKHLKATLGFISWPLHVQLRDLKGHAGGDVQLGQLCAVVEHKGLDSLWYIWKTGSRMMSTHKDP